MSVRKRCHGLDCEHECVRASQGEALAQMVGERMAYQREPTPEEREAIVTQALIVLGGAA